ncbi:MAG TPA: PF20097 family protein [Croceibacterium sp.]|nr:PF20097 family protein [Croceibacterium sp.]
MSKSCPKCAGRMEQGFVPEAKDYSTNVETWVEGAPRRKWWGIDFKGLKRLPIETWRCARCGYLESYAPA